MNDSKCRVYYGRGDVHVIHPVLDDRSKDQVLATQTIADHVPVSEVMTREVLCARHDLRASVLIDLMVHHHVGCIPVVDDRGRPVGMVTKLDLVEQIDRIKQVGNLDPQTAADLMMPLAMTLDGHSSVAHVAAMMTLEDIHHIPVVSSAGVMIGIVSTLDIVRWLARNDGYVGKTNEPTAGWTQPD